MAKNTRKFYVVWDGREPGVYETWEQCKLQVEGYTGAKYRSYPTKDAAQRAFQGEYPNQKGNAVNLSLQLEGHEQGLPRPVFPSLAVDAAWNTATGYMEYQGVDAKTGRLIFHQGPFPDGTNNIGEFLAIVHGLALLKQKNSNLPIYTDSMTAISWIRRKKANTKQEVTKGNTTLFELLERAEKWLQNNTWRNPLLKWETKIWGEIPADFGRK